MLVELLAQSSNAVGICGVVFLLTAFYLLSTSRLTAHHLQYQALNLTGAVLILFSLLFHWNTASVLIEIAWISISLIGIVRTLRQRKQPVSQNNVYMLKKIKKIDSGGN